VLDFTLFAQRQAKTHSTSSLRATALLEIAVDGRARLVPVVLEEGDKFFDAALYRANPRPLALDTGVVYEATRVGESVGLFTVSSAQQVQDVWVGLGEWRPKPPGEPGEPERKNSQAPTKSDVEADADAPPKLKRSKPSPTSSPSEGSQGSGSKSPDSSSTSSTSSPKSQTASTATPAESPLPADDTARPTLRRGKPISQSNDDLVPVFAEKPGTVQTAQFGVSGSAGSPVASTSAPKPVEVLIAVSDAAGPKPRSYAFPLKTEEHVKSERSLRQTAYDAIRKWAAIRTQHKSGALSEFRDVQLKVFDVNTSNEPELVFTGALPEFLPKGESSTFLYFATVVARLDMYGDLHTLLVQTTDSAHLDEYPRLELIDVVDADGSGIGQFLFREVTDAGYKYALYRISMEKLWLLFESSERSF
jgi:hypothetical protein